MEYDPEVAAYWASLTLRQKITGVVGSLAAGVACAGVIIAAVEFLL